MVDEEEAVVPLGEGLGRRMMRRGFVDGASGVVGSGDDDDGRVLMVMDVMDGGRA